MKRFIVLVLTVGVVSLLATPASALDLTNKLGVGANAGVLIPANGNIDANSSVSDIYNVGPSWGVQVKYGIVKWLSAEAGFNYAYMKIKDEANVGSTEESYINMPEIYIDGVCELGGLFNDPNNIWNPYLKVGAGLYPWKITTDGINGLAQKTGDGAELSKTSFALNFGAGLEVFATPNISFTAESKYHYVFSQDEDTFGPNFDNTGYLDIVGGLNYYFPLSK